MVLMLMMSMSTITTMMMLMMILMMIMIIRRIAILLLVIPNSCHSPDGITFANRIGPQGFVIDINPMKTTRLNSINLHANSWERVKTM